MKIVSIVGARPNFMKIAPVIRAIRNFPVTDSGSPITHFLVHTGQHYDYQMSKVFFENLELPEPDFHLGVGSGTHAVQTGRVMIEIEMVLLQEKPGIVIVVGDVNSTLAAALAAVKLHIPVAHVEAGLRSFDRQMPEEINRLLTDAISDYLFTPSPDANENLRKEGVAEDRISLVGNTMVDSLLYNRAKADESQILCRLGLSQSDYAIVTLHRPANVEDEGRLLRIIKAIKEVSQSIPIVFPVHPRTRQRLKESGLLGDLRIFDRLLPIGPLGYLDFLCLMMNARFVMTDSGGIQEETTVLDIPCLTLRNTTERPITVSQGTNVLVGNDTERIVGEACRILDGCGKKGKCPQLWDGKAAERIIAVLCACL